MADPFGNYQVSWATPPSPPTGSLGFLLNGTGAPASTLGSNGYLYVNLSNGDVYEKINGAWSLFTGGGGGGVQQVFVNAGDPNGVVSSGTTEPCLCIDTTNGIMWAKTDGINSNTGWTSP